MVPLFGEEGPLGGEGGLERLPRGGEGRAEGVAYGLEDVAASRRYGGAQDFVVTGEGRLHLVGIVFPEGGRALHISKEECYGAGRWVTVLSPKGTGTRLASHPKWLLFLGR